MTSTNLNGIAILNVQGVIYRCNINGITKREAVNVLQSADLNKTKWDNTKYEFFNCI